MASSEHTVAEHTASETSPTTSAAASAQTTFNSHSRTLSMVAENAPLRPNRLSLQFPIQPSRPQSPTRASYPPVTEPARASPDLLDTVDGPLDGNYLHLIAAQERRVLELKEELQRAATHLNKLKIEWAKHEAGKKRDDAKRLMKLEPLQTALPASDREDDSDGSSAWMQQEMERRKALLSGTKSSHRTVFPGQRHTRALSLLSPTGEYANSATSGTAGQRPPPSRKESLKNPARQSTDESRTFNRPVTLSRSSTTTAIPDGYEQGLDPEGLLRAGKKVASGLTDGLWTFWEDLRQATVGEESTTIHPPRRKSSTQTLKTARKQGSKNSLRDSSHSSSMLGKGSPDIKKHSPGRPKSTAPVPSALADPSFWTDHASAVSQLDGQIVTKKSNPSKQGKSSAPAKRLSLVSNDGWDTWDDSPVQSRSSSSVTSETNTLPSTVSGSPRTSPSTNRDSVDMSSSRKEAIPWPALKKSGLGTLRRTASHLLTEWERSLTPSPGNEYTGEDYTGASAEAAAYGAATDKGKND